MAPVTRKTTRTKTTTRTHKVEVEGKVEVKTKTQATATASGICFLCSLAAFTLVALDQKYTKGLQTRLDLPTYAYVAKYKTYFSTSVWECLEESQYLQHLSGIRVAEAFSKIVLSKVTLGKLLSNAPVIIAALSSGFIALYHCVSLLRVLQTNQFKFRRASIGATSGSTHVKGVLRFALIVLFGYFCGGKGFGRDTIVMESLKDYFGRARPPSSSEMRSLAFPSGHTNGASFFVGTLWTLMLPNFFDGVKRSKTKQVLQVVLLDGVSWCLWWACLVGATAAGRVASEKHWVSDTIAGALFGVLTTSILCKACIRTETFISKHKTM